MLNFAGSQMCATLFEVDHSDERRLMKRYRYRMYPTKPQQRYLAKLFGCTRVVYNDYLRARQEAYQTHKETGKKMMSHGDLVKQVLTQAKNTSERGWLGEVQSQPLISATQDAKLAFDNFFKSITGKRKGPKLGFPKFKNKFSKQSAYFARTSNPSMRLNLTTHGVGIIKFSGIAKRVNPLERVRFTYHRALPEGWTSVTVIKEADESYWLSFVVEPPEVEQVPPTHPGRAVGVDAGIGDDLIITAYSDGSREKIKNSRHYRKSERRLACAQRKLSRKMGGRKGEIQSNRYKRQKLRVAKLHAKVRRTRDYEQHVISKKLVAENEHIAVETLSLKGMVKNRRLAKSVNDASIGSLYQKLSYKAADQNRTLTKISQWEPSSRTCSVCGTYGDKKPLHIRKWTCSGCGTYLDRDYNAAVNILVAAGLAETLNGRGGHVSLRLASATT